MIASKYLTSGQYYVTLKENFSVILWIDSAITCVPFYLIDDSGKDLPIWNINYDMDYIQILRECFPISMIIHLMAFSKNDYQKFLDRLPKPIL